MNKFVTTTLLSLVALLISPIANAQKTTAEGIAEYRAMLADGNPAELYEAKGEALWKQARGPKNESLEKCDLGKGAGVVKGAFVELPRFFADTQRVQDLESRLLTCMEVQQGFNAQEIAKTPFGAGEQKTIESLVAYVSAESRDMTFNVPQTHAQEKLMSAVGQKLFYLRGGPMDFACASCHGEDNKRIRLQDLPNLTKEPSASNGFGSWPAYRVSSGNLWSMQHRLNDCYRQQRFPYPGYASDVTIALSVYMGVNSKGGVSTAPGLKR
jgi:sulfur-oxidizing protein SoxA